MSSPPSISSLKISEEEWSTKPAIAEQSTSTPAVGEEKPSAPNGETKASSSAQQPQNTPSPVSQPQQRPAPTQPLQRGPPPSRPSPSNMPQRPSPNLPAASAPSIPGRPGAGGPMRGGMQGPMGMGMRGRGGPSRGAPALPPSLQAKMDAVSFNLRCIVSSWADASGRATIRRFITRYTSRRSTQPQRNVHGSVASISSIRSTTRKRSIRTR